VEELAEINKQLTEALSHTEGDEEKGDSGKRAIASFEAKANKKQNEKNKQNNGFLKMF
jgi:hypothetical protein